MANSFDKKLESLKDKPVFSGLATAFGAAALGLLAAGGMAGPLAYAGLTAIAASPLVSAAQVGTACVSMFRDRSALSKAFSLASGAAAIAGGIGFIAIATAQDAGLGALLAPIATTLGMTVAGAFGIASHYTRNTHLTVSASLETRPDGRAGTQDSDPPKPGPA